MSKYKVVKVDEVQIDSLIKRNFSRDFMKKIYDVYSDIYMSIVEKTIRFDKIFTEEFGGRKDYRRIGEGTNRFVCLLDNHIIKVAYNYLAYIDNMNELAMSKYLPKQLALAYETNGIILVSEYVTVMDKEDFLESQSEIQFILTKLESKVNIHNKEKSLYYILGDMGMSNKNYGNWGRRMNGDIVVLDYGYLYEVDYVNWRNIAKCPICGSSLSYTDDYSELSCDGDKCNCTVKYTTLRNNLGYANIIDNINKNINNDKYVKFDENGSIVVDVMEKVEIEEEPKEEFEMPIEYKSKLDLSMSTFFDIVSRIKQGGQFSITKQMRLKEEFNNDVELYDEVLFPFILLSPSLTTKNVDSYLNDFNKLYTDRYNDLFNELSKDFKLKEEEEFDMDSYYEMMSVDDEELQFNVNGATSNIKLIDRLSKDNEGKQVVTSLDDLLSMELGGEFDNLFMADENKEILDKFDEDEDEYTFDSLMEMLSNDMIDKDESNDEDIESDDIEELLESRYLDLKRCLTSLLEIVMADVVEEDNFVTGDSIYQTYLNGDYIDYDYSPEVNASNILGGWSPDEFAFPLYRHLLIMMNYETDDVDYEYEAKYRIDQDVRYPEDIYDRAENRSIVIDQILNRIETNKPSKSVVINTLGRELDLYYEALDKYYENIKEENQSVDINDPNYYLEAAKVNSDLIKDMQNARDNLEDEVIDSNNRLSDLLVDNKIVYYYDTEYLYNEVEYRISDIIKHMKCLNRDGSVKDIKEEILNRYFMEYRSVLSDNVFDMFKYGGSVEVDCGNDLYQRIRKPILKAKLVPKESNEDTFKPQVFNKERYTIVRIEQRYDTVFKDHPEDATKLNDIILELNKRCLYYNINKTYKYILRGSKDNKRYLLSEKEVEVLDEYQDIYGVSDIKDKDNLYADTIVELLNKKYKLNGETYKLFKDVAKHGINEALGNRSFIINALEMSGSMTRLEYLNNL